MPENRQIQHFCRQDVFGSLPVGRGADPEISRGAGCDMHSETHLAQCIAMWYGSLSASLSRLVIKGLQGFADRFSDVRGFDLATACSGTDIVHRVLRRACMHFKHAYNIDIKVSNSFSCEKDLQKVAFIKSQHDPSKIFMDVVDLSKAKAWDHVTSSSQLVPFAAGFAVGFSCVSRSPANQHSVRNVGCIQNKAADSASSITYEGSKQYIKVATPQLITLENVKELEQVDTDDAEAESDADVIMAEMREVGYAMGMVRFDAADYGSWPRRIRLYFYGFFGDTVANRARVRLVKRLMMAMEIKPGAAEEVLLDDEQRQEWTFEGELERAAKKAKRGASQSDSRVGYKGEHMEIFASVGVDWPPTLDPKVGIDFTGMTGRMQEVAWLVVHAFPCLPEHIGVWQASLL